MLSDSQDILFTQAIPDVTQDVNSTFHKGAGTMHLPPVKLLTMYILCKVKQMSVWLIIHTLSFCYHIIILYRLKSILALNIESDSENLSILILIQKSGSQREIFLNNIIMTELQYTLDFDWGNNKQIIK